MLHPEILTLRPRTSTNHPVDALESQALPEELNLSEGLAATLVERIMIQKKLKASHNGIDANEQMRNWKAMAQESFVSKKTEYQQGFLQLLVTTSLMMAF
jgi:hypothetical protein